jgi:predicted ATP-dependent serine protease
VPIAGLAKKITPGPGHLILVQGAPGIGKSMIALWWALNMDRPALYLSIDSDLATQAARTVSMLTGTKFSDVRGSISEWQSYLRTLDRTLPMMFDNTVTADDIDGMVRAFKEFYTFTPSLVVVDNLKDIIPSYTFENVTDAIRQLVRVAKRHKTTVLVLHHVNRGSGAGAGNRPPSMDSGKFGGEDDAQFVIGLWDSFDEYVGPCLKARINKNRFGPKGDDVKMQVDWERCQVRDA